MKISVVTVCYNAAATIGDTLASVAAQRGVDVEAIVIDGGSKDGTQDVIAPWRDKIAHYVSEPDRGIYHAMNKGLSAATGDYVGFLNADDAFFSDDVLARIAETGARTGATVIAGGIRQTDNAGRPVRTISSVGFRGAQLRFGVFPPHPATYVRREFARSVGAFDEQFRIAADFDYFVRLHAHPDFRFEAIDAVLVSMRRGGASTSGLSAYATVSRDMLGALRKQDPGAPSFPVYLRALTKISQFMPALGMGTLRK